MPGKDVEPLGRTLSRMSFKGPVLASMGTNIMRTTAA